MTIRLWLCDREWLVLLSIFKIKNKDLNVKYFKETNIDSKTNHSLSQSHNRIVIYLSNSEAFKKGKKTYRERRRRRDIWLWLCDREWLVLLSKSKIKRKYIHE